MEGSPRGHGGRGGYTKVLLPTMGIAREIQGKVQNLLGSKDVREVSVGIDQLTIVSDRVDC